tara:strand:- start:184 stop:522 length:339 start_codon:yes stop_codon:yes gene_type:complete
LKLLIDFLLRKHRRTVNKRAIVTRKVRKGIANGLDRRGIGELVIKIPTVNVEATIDCIDLIGLLKHILRSNMCDTDFGGNGEEGKVSSLSRHTNLSCGLKQLRRNGIPRSPA